MSRGCLMGRPYLWDTRETQLSPSSLTLCIPVMCRAHASFRGMLSRELPTKSLQSSVAWVFILSLSNTQPLQWNPTINTGYKRLNNITIKFGMEYKPTKHNVVNNNFTSCNPYYFIIKGISHNISYFSFSNYFPQISLFSFSWKVSTSMSNSIHSFLFTQEIRLNNYFNQLLQHSTRAILITSSVARQNKFNRENNKFWLLEPWVSSLNPRLKGLERYHLLVCWMVSRFFWLVHNSSVNGRSNH